MKKFSKIILMILLVTFTCVALVACNNDGTTKPIVLKSGMTLAQATAALKNVVSYTFDVVVVEENGEERHHPTYWVLDPKAKILYAKYVIPANGVSSFINIMIVDMNIMRQYTICNSIKDENGDENIILPEGEWVCTYSDFAGILGGPLMLDDMLIHEINGYAEYANKVVINENGISEINYEDGYVQERRFFDFNCTSIDYPLNYREIAVPEQD